MAEHTAGGAPYQPAGSVLGYSPAAEYGGGLPMPPPMYRNPYAVELGGHNPSEMLVPGSAVQHNSHVPSTPKLQ